MASAGTPAAGGTGNPSRLDSGAGRPIKERPVVSKPRPPAPPSPAPTKAPGTAPIPPAAAPAAPPSPPPTPAPMAGRLDRIRSLKPGPDGVSAAVLRVASATTL